MPRCDRAMTTSLSTIFRPARSRSIGILGASGGLGASTLAAGLATRAAAAAHETLLVDLDRGGGDDVLLGCEREPGPRWADLSGATGVVDAHAVMERLPRSEHGVAVLCSGRAWHPLPADTVAAVCSSLRTEVDVTVFDLGRFEPPWVVDLDAVLVLMGATVQALAAAEVTTDRLLQVGVSPWLLTRGLEPRWDASISEALEVPILGRVPDDRRMADDVEVGNPPGRRSRSAFSRLCDGVLRDVLVESEVVR